MVGFHTYDTRSLEQDLISNIIQSYNIIPSRSFNNFRIARILEVKHELTNAEIILGTFEFSFNHGLGFVPMIVGTFYNTINQSSCPIPYMYFSLGHDYSTNKDPQSASLIIDRVNKSDLIIKIVLHDLLGLSFFAANNILKFKLYCLEETNA